MVTRLLPSALVMVLAWTLAVPADAQTIDTIQINQAIGVQKNNNRKFVAGKDTVVRALLSEPVTVDRERTSATITRDGQPVATISPNGFQAATAVVDFLCPSREACGGWAAGDYVFEVTVNGATASTAGTPTVFVERAGLRVLALPVKANYGGVIRSVEGDAWKTMGDYTQKVYPIAPNRFSWTIRSELDASDASFNLETDEGMYNLWQALAKLNPPQCEVDKTEAGCFDKIVGFVQSRNKGYPNGSLQGYTFGSPANIVVASDEDAEATVAHEIAHTMEIGDAYDGGSFHCPANPVPDTFTGKNFKNPTEPAQCTAGRTQLPGVSGTLVPASHHPYDVGGRGPLGDSAEYMGSGGQQAQFWTSQDAYDWIFDRLAPVGAASVAPRRPGLMVAAPTRLMYFSGRIRQNGASAADLTLDPWESFIDEDDQPDTSGPLMIAAVDAAGQRLATQAFAPQFDFPGPKGLPRPTWTWRRSTA